MLGALCTVERLDWPGCGVRVLIADSEQTARSALKLLIWQCRPDAEVLETRSITGIFEHLARHEIDVAMIDWALLRRGGYRAVTALHESSHCTYVIVLSGHPLRCDDPAAAQADAYVDMSLPPDSLHTILGQAMSCRAAVSGEAPDARAGTLRPGPSAGPHELLT